ncbi:MAG: hypothetical protein U0527_11835 [Candidatus Eisenbacteria bacterium]
MNFVRVNLNGCALALSALSFVALTAQAQTQAQPQFQTQQRTQPWRFSITPYLWATDVGVESKLNDREVLDQTIKVSDLIDDIDTIFQLRLEATRGAFGITADAFDVTMSDEKKGATLPAGAGTADLDYEVGLTIVDLAGLYDPFGDHKGLAFLTGVRVIDDRANVDASFQTSASGPVEKSFDSEETLVDALIGSRFTQRLGRHWATQAQADVSFGGTNYTWSVGPTLAFNFGAMNQFGVNAGYRHMEVHFKQDGALENKLSLSGFVLGLRTSF